MPASRGGRHRVLLGATTAAGARTFYWGLAKALVNDGYEVVVLAPDADSDRQGWEVGQNARRIGLRIERDPAPAMDVMSLVQIIWILLAERPSVAIWGSPKISLLGVLASRLTRVRSIYVIHGLRYQGSLGISRSILVFLEKLCARLADHVVAVGKQVKDVATEDGLASRDRIQVIANGSANSFAPPVRSSNARELLGLPDDAVVFAFVGRLTRDKGVAELYEAWTEFETNSGPAAVLLIAGAVEDDLKHSDLIGKFRSMKTVRFLGHLNDLSALYSAADVLVLPSYREGLPTVVLEAAASGIPAIVSDSTGTCEPVVDGQTGLVTPAKDVAALVKCFGSLASNGNWRRELGQNARQYVNRVYGPQVVYPAWSSFIEARL